jgi:hypothetical protein
MFAFDYIIKQQVMFMLGVNNVSISLLQIEHDHDDYNMNMLSS